MKKRFTLVLASLCLFYTQTVCADASSTETPITNTSGDLTQAFQKEYVYLASQKQALLKVQKQTTTEIKTQTQQLKKEANNLQNELVAVSSKNDEKHEYLMSLEKRKKELEKKGSSLENSYKKAHALIHEMNAGLKFEIIKDKESAVQVPEDLKISSFEEAFNKTNQLITASSRVQSYNGTFLDEQDKLTEGSITRFGRSAAIGSVGDKHFVLAPNGAGLLKALEEVENPSGAFSHLFIFDNLAKEGKIKYQAGIMEKLADFSPILFLGLILLLVGSLFAALIKV
jgi:predicted RNase H-like nuclease (RuvC/YqgF family)